MSVTQITSTGGTISLSPSGGTGVVDMEVAGTAVTSLPNGVGFIVGTDPVPFEHVANTTTYQISASELIGLVAVKPAVNAVAVANISTLSGVVTVDSIALTTGQLVLLTGQTTPRQNGPWVIQSGAWTRPAWYYSDATGGSTYTTNASAAQAYAGVTMQSLGGSLYSGTSWQLMTIGSITIDSATAGATSWSQVTGVSGVVGVPGGVSTDVQYNNSNVLAGSGNFTFTSSTNMLTVGGGTGTAGTITTGPTASASPGYALTLEGGTGGATSGNGGAILVKGGPSTNGIGGGVLINSAGGTGGYGGGVVQLVAGSGGTVGQGGAIGIGSGPGGTTSGNAGSINLNGGNTAGTGVGGSIYLTSGDATSGAAGNVDLSCGTSESGVGGSIQFTPGSGAVSATNANDGVSQFFTAEGNNALCIDRNGNTINGFLGGATAGTGGLGAYVDQGYFLPTAAPVTGGTFTIPAYTSSAIFHPAGTLATQTFVFPPNPVDGQLLEISFTQAITTPTWPAAALGAPSTVTANTGASWRWSASLAKWERRV